MRNVRFNISDAGLPGIGKIGVEGTNDEAVAADIYLSVSIGGTTVFAETLIAGGVAAAAPYTSYVADIPEDTSTGLYMTGVYTVNIIAKAAGASTVLATHTGTFGFDPYTNRPAGVSITNSIDCNEGSFVLKDETVYAGTGFQSVDREWTVTPGSYQGVPVGPSVSGNDDFVKVFFTYVNITYAFSFEADVTYQLFNAAAMTVSETHTFSESSEYKVECGNDLAGIKQCVYDTLASIEGSACRVGGFDKLPSGVKEKWLKLQQYMAGWQFAESINDWDSRRAFYLKVASLLKCECEVDDTVRAFVLPDGSQSVETAWQTVATVFQNSFLNAPNALKWKVDKNNFLRIRGKIQVPAGLAANNPHTITTGFVPASLLSDVSYENRAIAFDAAGVAHGTVTLEPDTDLVFRTGTSPSTLTFVYIDMNIPLDI